jgi:hypothetical protein
VKLIKGIAHGCHNGVEAIAFASYIDVAQYYAVPRMVISPIDLNDARKADQPYLRRVDCKSLVSFIRL